MGSAVLAPVTGRVVGLSGVPDPVFADGVVGPGTAIDPERAPSEALAPVGGRIVKLHPHAFVVAGDDGRGVLVHLGIDTVRLEGAGFESTAAQGDTVRSGQPVVRWDPAAVEAAGYSPVCPVVALDATRAALHEVREDGTIDRGDQLFVWM